MKLLGDFYLDWITGVIKSEELKYPGFAEWWKKQPENFLDEAVNEFLNIANRNNIEAINTSMPFVKSEIMLCGRFYRNVNEWAKGEIKAGRGSELARCFIPLAADVLY